MQWIFYKKFKKIVLQNFSPLGLVEINFGIDI